MIYKIFRRLWYQHLFVIFIALREVTDSMTDLLFGLCKTVFSED